MSFEFRGRVTDGVPAFTGSDAAPSLFEWVLVLALGVTVLGALAAGSVASIQ